ncbi:hypothetical protein TWF696_000905 [Orbilia brochopaga]|uniref:F-box domain-containing protein n=1 Tax=Orbilia brochopaga TaxID=3140254 RepID=A0AAV9VFQ5_9PEZI
MATIETIALDIYLEILSNLPIQDFLSLKQCSKTLNRRTSDAHPDNLLETRAYSIGVPDLKKLLVLSQHPMARLTLKHLVVGAKDPGSRYPDKRNANNLVHTSSAQLGQGDEFTKLWQEQLGDDESLFGEDEGFVLLSAAFENLPNLETIEFCSCPAHMDESKMLQRNPPSRYAHETRLSNIVQFHSFAKPEPEGSTDEGKINHYSQELLDRVYSLTINALRHASFKLRAIRFHEDCAGDAGSWINSMFFHPICGNLQDISPALRNLKILQLNIRAQSSLLTDPLHLIKESQRAGLRFAADTAPGIRDLSLAGMNIKLKDESEKHWPSWEPGIYSRTILLDNAPMEQPVTFRYLRNLHLDTLVFRSGELRAFLQRHQSTLRHLTLHKCLLDSQHQTWSGIFEFVGTELSLETFEYEVVSWDVARRDADRLNWLWGIKLIPWFRFSGDVRTNGECCEFLSKEAILRGDPPYKVDFTDAMAVIARLENLFILGGLIPNRWSDRERCFQGSVTSVYREGAASSEYLYNFNMDPLFRLYIRPKDIKEVIRDVRLERLARSRAGSVESQSVAMIGGIYHHE